MNHWKKVFAIIWGGQFISLLTSSVVNFAIVLWLSIEMQSAEVLAYGAIAAFLPQSVLGFFAGVYVDRWNRKITMIAADSFIALCTLMLAILFWKGEVQLGYVYVLLALRSVGSSFHMPAMQASVPLLAPESELMRIAGINQVIESVSNIAGPAIAALLISFMEIGNILLLDVFGAVAACTSLLFVKIPNPVRDKTIKPHLWREIKEGVREVVTRKGLNYLFLYSILMTLFMMPVSIMFPLMTLDHFGGTPFQIGLIEMVWGGGTLVGGLLVGIWKFRGNRVVLVNVCCLVIGLSFLFSGLLSPAGFFFFVILSTIGGVAGSVYHSAFMSIVQEKVDPGLLGRVVSYFFSFAILSSMISLLATGFLADTIGMSRTFVIMGGLIVVVGGVSFLIPSLMRLDRKDRI